MLTKNPPNQHLLAEVPNKNRSRVDSAWIAST